MRRRPVPLFVRSPEHLTKLAVKQGFDKDPRNCWWVVRVNPVGTLELRILDMQEKPRHAAEIGALLRVILRVAEENRSKRKTPEVPSRVIHQELLAVARGRRTVCHYRGRIAEILDQSRAFGGVWYDYISSLYCRLYKGTNT